MDFNEEELQFLIIVTERSIVHITAPLFEKTVTDEIYKRIEETNAKQRILLKKLKALRLK